MKGKNYRCNSCGKSFSESENLKKHILTIHEIQSNYKCDYCGKSFTTSENMMKHNKNAHKSSSCFLCTNGLLNRNKIKIHGQRQAL